MLKVEHMTLRFGELVANSDISLEIPMNKITGLIGPNGAGKTTCFNCISGVYVPNEGTIDFDGKIINGLRPHKIHELGVSRTYQIINLFADMPAIDNVIVGMHDDLQSNFFESMFHTKKEREEEERAKEKAKELLEFVGLGDKMYAPAGSFPYGQQRLLEIARALASDPLILLLDEPAAGMNSSEKKELDKIIKKIRERWDVGILVVEHDMDLVMHLCDYIYVLSFGQMLASGTPEEISKNKDVIAAYLGGDEE